MTKKDYVQFAQALTILRKRLEIAGKSHDEIYEELVDMLARIFADDNSRFDYARFRKACGLTEE
jgi:hypothetical protein